VKAGVEEGDLAVRSRLHSRVSVAIATQVLAASPHPLSMRLVTDRDALRLPHVRGGIA